MNTIRNIQELKRVWIQELELEIELETRVIEFRNLEPKFRIKEFSKMDNWKGAHILLNISTNPQPSKSMENNPNDGNMYGKPDTMYG